MSPLCKWAAFISIPMCVYGEGGSLFVTRAGSREKRAVVVEKAAEEALVLRLELYWHLVSFNVFMLLLKDSLAALFAPDCGLQSIGSRLNFTASSWVTWEMSFSFKKCVVKAGLVLSLKRIFGDIKKGGWGARSVLFVLSLNPQIKIKKVTKVL